MPGFDKTGPVGLGPGTGRGRGQCVEGVPCRRGMAESQGRGRGCGRWGGCQQGIGRDSLQERINALEAELDSLREQLRK